MGKNLLIVESPAKAKTIEKYLGKEFEVKSSFGHIRDLEKEGMGIDIENGFEPSYTVSEDKRKVVQELKQKAKGAKEVWLATDEDREGEAISWHLCEVLGLDPRHTKRIVFHEITKPAIQKAVASPRTVNMDLVDAQQARRVLDRLVGFEISPVLWRKLSGGSSLSAGRVQSVAVKLIVEREREINQFRSVSDYRIEARFAGTAARQTPFKAEGARKKTQADAEAFLDSCKQAQYTVSDVQVKPAKKSPAPPFTTSTLQQEASRKLGMSVSRTMRVAQSLYENGYITYMRTDSVNLSDTALENARGAITRQFGEQYHQQRRFQTKNQSAQEAHEAIRPTDLNVAHISDPDGYRLYDLIWKRTIASQMADAQLEKTTVKINISTNNEQLTAQGEVIKFDGFLKVYIESSDEEPEDDNNPVLPAMRIGEQLNLDYLKATERFSRPAPRYTEASLVKKLEELGIGRPSTYAPTISTIQQRNYVERRELEGTKRSYNILTLQNDRLQKDTATEITGADKNKLFPTDLGMVVTDFLSMHFTQIMDYGFTANIENQFDNIARGKEDWKATIKEFYYPFHETVKETMETAERAKGEHILGTDPQSGKQVVARLGRFGPMVQIGSNEDEETPRFASLRKNQSIETITLEEALDLFKLPMDLGQYEGQDVSVGIGRFGPYVKYGETFISLPKGEDPLTVDMDRAIAVIREKELADAPIGSFKGEPVTKGKGRFGPFIRYKDLFINVPKAYDFDHLSQQDINELIEKKLDKEANRYIAQWEDEKIAIENGRWGPFVRFGKQMLKLGRKVDGEKYTAEDLKDIDLETVKAMIKEQVPDAFEKKKAAAKKKTAAKKSAAKKTAVKKSTAKKTAAKKTKKS
ncbi:MAG: DNA topoisomerase I [Bacteroidetes bacterium 47-18]|nr:MAG: DNA topoisomerase I [Bacteroidetes bacterium 47-18]